MKRLSIRPYRQFSGCARHRPCRRAPGGRRGDPGDHGPAEDQQYRRLFAAGSDLFGELRRQRRRQIQRCDSGLDPNAVRRRAAGTTRSCCRRARSFSSATSSTTPTIRPARPRHRSFSRTSRCLRTARSWNGPAAKNFRLFAVHPLGHLTIKKAHIRGFRAQGGNGGLGGGGGMGAGGAIYVMSGSLVVEASTFSANIARGGAGGGSGHSGGGGGIGGNGGVQCYYATNRGGTGGGGSRGNGSTCGGPSGGGGGGTVFNAPGQRWRL